MFNLLPDRDFWQSASEASQIVRPTASNAAVVQPWQVRRHKVPAAFILQGRLIAPFFVCWFCSCSGLLVQIPGLFCVRGVLRIFIERKLSNVSFTGAFTGKYVVKSIKEACETVHNTPQETCQHATQFDQPCKTACFWWVKETPKDAQECDLGSCKFVGYFHVSPSSYVRSSKGLQCPKETSKKYNENRCASFKPTRTHVDPT